MPDQPVPPRPHDSGDDHIGDVFSDFPLDADLRELYLRVRLDGAVWRSQQPEDDGSLAAYAVALAEEAPVYVDIPSLELDELHAAPATRKLRERTRRARGLVLLGDVGVFIAVAAVVAMVSVTLLRLSPLAASSGPTGAGSGPTPLATATATLARTPTATPRPKPTATPQPTIPPLVAFMPHLEPQPNGQLEEAFLMRNGSEVTCSPDAIVFEVTVGYTHSITGTYYLEWQFYDGSQLLANPNSNAYPNNVDWTPGSSTSGANYLQSRDGFSATLYLTSSDLTSQPRWGAQFLITAVNGKPLATPIASPILRVPTPAC